MEQNTESISQTIIDTINTIFSSLFSSIDNSLYDTLNDLAFLSEDLLKNSFFTNFFHGSSNHNILLVANSLLIGFSLYYCIRLLFSYLIGNSIEHPYSFLMKLFVYGICMNQSLFFCKECLNLNFLLSSSILEIGENLLGKAINFNSLIHQLNQVISVDTDALNVFSFDGIIRSFSSVSLLNLILSYSLRYIMVQLFVFLCPFAFLTLLNKTTAHFFYSWLRIFLSLLLLQNLIAFILVLLFSIPISNHNIFSKLYVIGCLYALMRANHFMQSLIGGINTNISVHMQNLKNSFKSN